MYLTTERIAKQVRYLYIVLGLCLSLGTFMATNGSAVEPGGLFLLGFPLLVLFVLILRGKFILEIDTDTDELLISNRPALFNTSVPFFINDLKISKNDFLGFWIENHIVVRRLVVKYKTATDEIATTSFSLSSVSSYSLKALKASLSRITVQNNRRPELLD